MRIRAGSRRKPIHQNISIFFVAVVVCFPCFYLSGLQPGFGGRGLLKSSRLTPCSTALSPAPRTHGWARSRAHRTWIGEGGSEQEEEEEEMVDARAEKKETGRQDEWKTERPSGTPPDKWAGCGGRLNRTSVSWPPATVVAWYPD